MSDITELSIEPDPVPEPRRGSGRIAAGLVAVVAVLGAAIFAVNTLSADDNQPADPVRAMFAAAEHADVVGVLEQLLPGERDALKDPLTHLVDELNRLEVLDDAHLDGIDGVQLEVDDLALDATKVSDDLASVRVTGGRARYRVDLAKLPLGDFVLDLLGDRPSGTQTDSDTLESDDAVTTVRRDGRWYVSIGYTIAEQARRDAGVSLDDLGPGVAPAGAPTAEAAVRDMVTAASELDLRRIVGLLSPDELGALQRYAGLFLDDAERGLASARRGFSGKVRDLDLSSDVHGDDAVVRIDKIAFDASFGEGGRFSYDGSCVSFAAPAELRDLGIEVGGDEGGDGESRICPGDDPTEALGMLGGGVLGTSRGGTPPPKLSFQDERPDTGIAVHRIDGQWYVSPVRTGLDAVVAVLHLVQRSDLDAIARYVRETLSSFGGGWSAIG